MRLKGRDLASILDRETERTRDIRPAIYLGPYGTQLHRVQIKGTASEIIITSAQGRKTWPPGMEVPVGSYGQKSAPFILGDPPPGHRGGAKFAPRTYPAGPPPVEEPNLGFLVLYEDPAFLSTLQLSTHGPDGSWQSDLASHAFGGPGVTVYANGAQLIRSDPFAQVSAGSILLVPSNGDVTVWDWMAGNVHQVVPLDSHGNWAALWPLWREGYVYWAQFEHLAGSADYTFTLYRAKGTLASPVALGSVTGTFGAPDAAASQGTFFAGRAASDGYRARCQIFPSDNPSISVVVYFNWDGTGGTIASGTGWNQTNNCTGIEWPGVAGKSFVPIDPTDPPGTVPPLSWVDGGGAEIYATWPATIPAYIADGQPVGSVVSVDARPDGLEALALSRVHSNAGGTLGVDDFLTCTIYSGDPLGTEPAAAVVAPHPATGGLPGSAFFR